MLFCNSFSAEGIRIITENRELGQLLPKLFKKAFNITFDIQPEPDACGKQLFQITQPQKLERIMSEYGFSTSDTLALHLNLPLVAGMLGAVLAYYALWVAAVAIFAVAVYYTVQQL